MPAGSRCRWTSPTASIASTVLTRSVGDVHLHLDPAGNGERKDA